MWSVVSEKGKCKQQSGNESPTPNIDVGNTKLTIGHNAERTHLKLSEQLFPNLWSLRYRDLTKYTKTCIRCANSIKFNTKA